MTREQSTALLRAAAMRDQLEREVAGSHATAHEKAFIQQRIAHLWTLVMQLPGRRDET